MEMSALNIRDSGINEGNNKRIPSLLYISVLLYYAIRFLGLILTVVLMDTFLSVCNYYVLRFKISKLI